MQYWIIMGALVVVALILLAVIIITLVKSKKRQDAYDYDDDYEDDYEDEYDEDVEEEEEYEQPRRQSRGKQVTEDTTQVPERVRSMESQPAGPVKRQWKIILENLDTWEKFTFIFYDNIGIGRGKNNQEFEKYLSVPDDPRVSKLHCAIIRKGDKLYLKDMGARNGTFLNGEYITQPVVIQRDDVIGIGETKIEVKKVLRERG